jgi:hypothetical protein
MYRTSASKSRPSPGWAKTPAPKQGEHLVAEQLFGSSLVHVRDRDPLPAGGPASSCHQGVHVGVEVGPVSEGLNHGHDPGSEALLLPGRRGQELSCRLRCGPGQLSQQLPVVEEVHTQHLGGREDPLGVAHVLDDLVSEERRQLRGPLGPARGAQTPPLAGEGHQELLRALAAPHPRKAVVPDPTVEVAGHRLVRQPPPEAVLPLEPLLPRPLHPLVEGVEKTPKRRLPGVPGPIDTTGVLHFPPEAGSGRDAGKSCRRTLRLRTPSLDP